MNESDQEDDYREYTLQIRGQQYTIAPEVVKIMGLGEAPVREVELYAERMDEICSEAEALMRRVKLNGTAATSNQILKKLSYLGISINGEETTQGPYTRIVHKVSEAASEIKRLTEDPSGTKNGLAEQVENLYLALREQVRGAQETKRRLKEYSLTGYAGPRMN